MAGLNSPKTSWLLQIQHVVQQAGNALVDLVLPRRCPGCNQVLALSTHHGFCELCWQSVDPVVDPCTRCGVPGQKPHTVCGRCRADPPPYASVTAPWVYGGQLAVAIQSLKYGGLSHHCRLLGALLRDRFLLPECIDWALPVPLHRKRLQRRGFNQAALLAVEALRGTGVKVRFDLIRRTRDTTRQAGLDLSSRQENVRGAFASSCKEVSGARLLLVDDVMTTGSTVAECARTLISAGAKEVHVLTLARAMP